jgi:hypothetical protein
MEDEEFRRFVAQINDKLERILNRMTSLEGDFQNTKGFLVNDAAIGGRRWLDLEDRVTKLEDELRSRHG